jgi:hypothetical protein
MSDSVYQPGWYTCAVTVTMPADHARSLPIRARHNGDGTATCTFAPSLQTRLDKPMTGAGFAQAQLDDIQPGLRRVKHTIDSYVITPVGR